jgi:alkylation response protein AidB-like acyl-CoA dehydrogenase
MRFDFTPEQYALRDVARELFEKASPPSRLREILDGSPLGRDVWHKMAEVGITGVLSEGGDEVDLTLVLEEAGRCALPEPLVDTVAVGSRTLPAEWVRRIAAGDTLVAFRAWPWAGEADLVVDERDGALWAGGTRLEADPSEASTRGAAATANVLNGVSMRLVEMTLDHVKERHQFGRPVGAFQAVKHKLATMHTLLDGARSAAWYASYSIARGLDDAARAASVAKACASDAHAFVNTEALQCHAGIGFTWEHDLHLWLKHGLALEAAWGTAREHRARLAADIFEGGFLDA